MPTGNTLRSNIYMLLVREVVHGIGGSRHCAEEAGQWNAESDGVAAFMFCQRKNSLGFR